LHFKIVLSIVNNLFNNLNLPGKVKTPLEANVISRTANSSFIFVFHTLFSSLFKFNKFSNIYLEYTHLRQFVWFVEGALFWTPVSNSVLFRKTNNSQMRLNALRKRQINSERCT